MNTEDILDSMRESMGIDKNIYHCVKCKYVVDKLFLKAIPDNRKAFYCRNKSCEQYGLLTVVVINRGK